MNKKPSYLKHSKIHLLNRFNPNYFFNKDRDMQLKEDIRVRYETEVSQAVESHLTSERTRAWYANWFQAQHVWLSQTLLQKAPPSPVPDTAVRENIATILSTYESAPWYRRFWWWFKLPLTNLRQFHRLLSLQAAPRLGGLMGWLDALKTEISLHPPRHPFDQKLISIQHEVHQTLLSSPTWQWFLAVERAYIGIRAWGEQKEVWWHWSTFADAAQARGYHLESRRQEFWDLQYRPFREIRLVQLEATKAALITVLRAMCNPNHTIVFSQANKELVKLLHKSTWQEPLEQWTRPLLHTWKRLQKEEEIVMENLLMPPKTSLLLNQAQRELCERIGLEVRNKAELTQDECRVHFKKQCLALHPDLSTRDNPKMREDAEYMKTVTAKFQAFFSAYESLLEEFKKPQDAADDFEDPWYQQMKEESRKEAEAYEKRMAEFRERDAKMNQDLIDIAQGQKNIAQGQKEIRQGFEELIEEQKEELKLLEALCKRQLSSRVSENTSSNQTHAEAGRHDKETDPLLPNGGT
jgi:hypothetical protein